MDYLRPKEAVESQKTFLIRDQILIVGLFAKTMPLVGTSEKKSTDKRRRKNILKRFKFFQNFRLEDFRGGFYT